MKKLYILTLALFSMSLAFAQGGMGVNAHSGGLTTGQSQGLRYKGQVTAQRVVPPAPRGGMGINHGAHGGHHAAQPMLNGQDMKTIIWDMQAVSCQITRMRIAKQTVRDFSVRSGQVRRLAKQLQFESDRATFLQYAFGFTIDPENYFMETSNVLVYQSSRLELERFLVRQGFGPAPAATCGMGGSGSAYNGSYGSNGYYDNGAAAMFPEDFRMMERSIRNQPFENDKLAIAKQATTGRLLTSVQIRNVMHLFSFESTKLNFAKFAWDNLVLDQQNFYLVNDAFSFSSSVRNLDSYISGR